MNANQKLIAKRIGKYYLSEYKHVEGSNNKNYCILKAIKSDYQYYGPVLYKVLARKPYGKCWAKAENGKDNIFSASFYQNWVEIDTERVILLLLTMPEKK